MSKKQNEFLHNNLPRKYNDIRKIGNPISKEDLNGFINYAIENNVKIGTIDNITGGFEYYCGKKSVLYSIIDEIKMQMCSNLFIRSKVNNIILKYNNVLGYEYDKSKIDINAFAMTKGKTITLNKFMFDDTEFLIKQYNEAVTNGRFVKGSTINNIIVHEIGHIIENNTKGLYVKIYELVSEEAKNKNMKLDEYIETNISSYAKDLDTCNRYHELIPELNSLNRTDPGNYIINAIKNMGFPNYVQKSDFGLK